MKPAGEFSESVTKRASNFFPLNSKSFPHSCYFSCYLFLVTKKVAWIEKGLLKVLNIYFNKKNKKVLKKTVNFCKSDTFFKQFPEK